MASVETDVESQPTVDRADDRVGDVEAVVARAQPASAVVSAIARSAAPVVIESPSS